MAMATSMLAPPLLRRVLRNFQGTPHERARLDLEAVLAATGGNISEAARRLGLHRQSLQRKLRKYPPRR